MVSRVTLPQWVTEAAEKTPRPELVYNQPPATPKESPELAAFLSDIYEVCESHGLWITCRGGDIQIVRQPVAYDRKEIVFYD